MNAIATGDDAGRLHRLGEGHALLFEERIPTETIERDEIMRIEDVIHGWCELQSAEVPRCGRGEFKASSGARQGASTRRRDPWLMRAPER